MNLSELKAALAKAVEDRKAIVDGALNETRGLNADEKTQVEAIDEHRETLQVAIDEATRVEKDVEARKASGIERVSVVSEPTTYTENAPYSYFADMVSVSRGEGEAAAQRMAKHGHEMARELVNGSEAGKRVEARLKGQTQNEAEYRAVVARARNLGQSEMPTEHRVVTTTSGGAAYIVPEWLDGQAYKRAGTVVRDTLSKITWVPTLTWNVPVGSAAAPGGFHTEATEDNVADTPVTNIQATTQTILGTTWVSEEQLQLSANGIGPAFDEFVHEALVVSNGVQAEAAAINAILATGVITLSGDAGVDVPTFMQKSASAQALVRSTDGLVSEPDCIAVIPARVGWFQATAATDGRPYVTTDVQHPLNTYAAGSGPASPYGFSHLTLLGMDVYHTSSASMQSSGDYALIYDSSNIKHSNSGLNFRAVQAQKATSLLTALQAYSFEVTIPIRKSVAIKSTTAPFS